MIDMIELLVYIGLYNSCLLQFIMFILIDSYSMVLQFWQAKDIYHIQIFMLLYAYSTHSLVSIKRSEIYF